MINKYPYSDMHELNADWLLSKTAELEGKVKTLENAPKGVTSVTPYYNSGTKIADYDQDGVAGEIYIPNNPAVLEKSAINRFDDGIDSYFKKVVSSIQCVQTGSGVPSPSNPRPIYGFNDCTVTDVDNLDTPTETTTSTISFGAAGTVYGGEVDITTGVLTVTYGYADLGSLNWGYDSGRAGHFYTNSLASTIKAHGEGVCSHLEHKNVGANSTENYKISFVPSYGNGYIFAIDTDYSDATAFKTAMNGVQLVYELAAPIEYQLTPTQLRSLVGTNRLTSSTGEVTGVEYITNETIAWLLDQIV